MGGSDLFTGTLDLLILRALATGPLHGYGVGRWIRERSRGALDIEEGALYPALHRLERNHLVEGRWQQTDTGRRAKVYQLTAAGARQVEAEKARWTAHTEAVQAVLGET